MKQGEQFSFLFFSRNLESTQFVSFLLNYLSTPGCLLVREESSQFMAEHQFPTLIVKVDLECDKCSKRIRKIICKLQGPMNIRVIKYDEVNNQVILRGPFDPDELAKKLRCCDCKCHVIKDIQIVLPKPPPKPAPEPVPKPAPKPPEPVVVVNEPVIVVPEPVIIPVPVHEPVKEPEPQPTEPPSTKLDPEPPPVEQVADPAPEPVHIPPPVPVCTPPPVCCCRPCYEGYHGGCRCGSCGFTVIYAGDGGPPLIYNGDRKPYGDGPSGSGYPYYYCEEPSYTCSIM